jgi:hypothetical protein
MGAFEKPFKQIKNLAKIGLVLGQFGLISPGEAAEHHKPTIASTNEVRPLTLGNCLEIIKDLNDLQGISKIVNVLNSFTDYNDGFNFEDILNINQCLTEKVEQLVLEKISVQPEWNGSVEHTEFLRSIEINQNRRIGIIPAGS